MKHPVSIVLIAIIRLGSLKPRMPLVKLMSFILFALMHFTMPNHSWCQDSTKTSELIGKKLNTLDLEDQFENSLHVAFPTKKNVVLIFSSRQTNKEAKEWNHIMRGEVDSSKTQIENIAVVLGVPFFMRGFVRNSFKDKRPVWIDWGGDIAEPLGFEDTRCLVVLLGRTGVIQAAISGSGVESSKQQILKMLKE